MRAKQAGCCSKINSSYLSEIEFLGEEEHSDQGQNMEPLPHKPNTQQCNRSLLPPPIILLRFVCGLLYPSQTEALETDIVFTVTSPVFSLFILFAFCCLKCDFRFWQSESSFVFSQVIQLKGKTQLERPDIFSNYILHIVLLFRYLSFCSHKHHLKCSATLLSD